MNSKTMKRIVLIAILTFMALMAFSVKASASGHVDWEGGRPTDPGHGVFWTGEGVGTAWNKFVNINKIKYKGGMTKLKSVVNQQSGAPNPDGGRYTMWETCEKSEFVFWYGSNNNWTDNEGYKYYPGTWYTLGGTVNSPDVFWVEHGADAKANMDAYKASPGNKWATGKVFLICSYMYDKPSKEMLFFKANSATYKYDGTPKTVSGLNSGSNIKALKSGHTHNAVATKTATAEGEYDVVFNTIVIKDAKGKVVTGDYTINTEEGLLTITGDPTPPPDPDNNANYEWRCVDHISDSATANTRNKTVGYHGFTPSGAPSLSSLEQSRYTNAGKHVQNTYLPSRYESKSKWDNWKSKYQAGTDTITSQIDLDGAGVSDTLSKFGGVYNIYKSLKEDTYYVDHCQPEERHWIPNQGWVPPDPGQSAREYRPAKDPVYDKDGKQISPGRPERESRPYIAPTPGYWRIPAHWGPWQNAGGRIVWSTSGPSTKYIESNYQILSVNCNKDGFNQVWNQYGRADHSLANWDGGASMSTRETSGTGPGALGRGGHITARDSFYKDGTSCKNAFKCTADPLDWVSNDIIKNQNTSQLFNEVKNNKYIEVGSDNYLTFFRDNNDNEVRADIWHPRDTGLSDLEAFEGTEASDTIAKVYSGTPEIELTTIVPWKKYTGMNYSKITRIGDETMWNGMANRFIMKSQWTSNKDKPYQMGLNWKYEAEGRNEVPSRADGYRVISSTGYDGYYFDVYCEFENSNAVAPANIPDSPFINGRNNSPRFTNPLKSIKAFFTRSVSGN